MDVINQEKSKACPQCGSIFICTPADCWCAKLPPVMPMIENAECYCPKCLGEIIQKLADEKKAD